MVIELCRDVLKVGGRPLPEEGTTCLLLKGHETNPETPKHLGLFPGDHFVQWSQQGAQFIVEGIDHALGMALLMGQAMELSKLVVENDDIIRLFCNDTSKQN